jgi:deoxycytidine triphosphate deaminase
VYGNVLNNSQISALVKSKEISIEPFDAKKLKLAHYPLSAGCVLWATEISSTTQIRKFENRADFRNDEDYDFDSNEYAVVEINEFIKISEGIVGHFVPSSSLIEQGFGITAGKIDPGYGSIGGKKQQIRFGLKNLRQSKNRLKANQTLAPVFFIDLRGLNNLDANLSREEVQFLMQRYPRLQHARDSGVDYGDGNQ